MRTRIITALILAPIAVALILWLPEQQFAEVIMLLMIVGLFEWDNLTTKSNPGFVLGSMALLVVAVIIYLLDSDLVADSVPPLLPLLAVFGLLLWLFQFWTLSRGIDYRRAATTELGIGFITALTAWAAMVWMRELNPDGPRMVLVAIVAVWAADTFALIAGRLFGRHKLAPTISPGKTVEGVVGGLLGAVGIAWAGAYWLLDLAPGALLPWLLAAAAAALISVVGDLSISRLKRQAGVKDSGALIPGHGGLLDRIDGLLAAMPMFASIWWLAG